MTRLRCFVLILCASVSMCSGVESQGIKRALKLPTDYPVLCGAELDGSDAADAKTEAVCLKTLASVAKRQDNTLILKRDGGKLRKFEDRDPETADCSKKPCDTFRLIGVLNKPRYYVVRQYESELTNDLLVPLGEADEYSMAAPIHFSPSMQLAVSVSNNNGPSSRDFDLKVLEFFEGGSNLVFSFYNREAWEFVSFRNDNEINLRVGEGNVETQLYEATLAKDEHSIWHLNKTKDSKPKMPPAEQPPH